MSMQKIRPGKVKQAKMTLQGCNHEGERPELSLNSTPLKQSVVDVFSGGGKLVEK